MLKVILLIVCLSIIPVKSYSSTFFAPDSDTALLIELVSTTIEQLNELENLVTETERLTGKIQHYNEVAIDHWYRAQRVALLVDEMTHLKDTRLENLSELNSLVRQLKGNIEELKVTFIEYGILQIESQKTIKSTVKDDTQIEKDNRLADLQIKRAQTTNTPGNISKVNMEINAIANKNLVGIKNKNNQILKLIAEQNEHLAKEKREKLQKSIEQRCFYFKDECQKSK